MTIEQAKRKLRCKSDYALAKELGITHQAIHYWRKKMGGVLPHPWPAVVNARAEK